jgi:hypothetical protein
MWRKSRVFSLTLSLEEKELVAQFAQPFEGKERSTRKEVAVLVPCDGVDMVSFKSNESYRVSCVREWRRLRECRCGEREVD